MNTEAIESYIITTKTPRFMKSTVGLSRMNPTESRCAVPTLEEARKAIMDMHFHAPSYWPDLRPFHDSLSESGGTITIPDGTVIEVERVTYLHLDGAEGMGESEPRETATHQSILDAYNAREES